MKRAFVTLLTVMALATARVTADPQDDTQAGQRPAFRASTEAVTVDVAVRQGSRPVTGLGLGDFVVLDNGVAQRVVDMSYEKLPIDVTVAFDISASVTSKLLYQLHDAVQQLRKELGPADRLRLLTFNNRIRRAVDVTDKPSGIEAAFNRIRTGGSSAILDALAVALAAKAPLDRRQMVVVFSDGQDTSSINSPATLIDVVRQTTAGVYAVLPPPVPVQGSPFALFRPAADTGHRILAGIAEESGGLMATVGARQSLPDVFRRAFTEFRSSYVLHFVPTGVEQTGVHRLTVQVKREGAEVRARREYVRR